MDITPIIERISVEQNTHFEKEEVEEIAFLLENDVTIFHLAKTHLEEAIQEAISYITPDF